jgi:hypothetical protein
MIGTSTAAAFSDDGQAARSRARTVGRFHRQPGRPAVFEPMIGDGQQAASQARRQSAGSSCATAGAGAAMDLLRHRCSAPAAAPPLMPAAP